MLHNFDTLVTPCCTILTPWWHNPTAYKEIASGNDYLWLYIFYYGTLGGKNSTVEKEQLEASDHQELSSILWNVSASLTSFTLSKWRAHLSHDFWVSVLCCASKLIPAIVMNYETSYCLVSKDVLHQTLTQQPQWPWENGRHAHAASQVDYSSQHLDLTRTKSTPIPS